MNLLYIHANGSLNCTKYRCSDIVFNTLEYLNAAMFLTDYLLSRPCRDSMLLKYAKLLFFLSLCIRVNYNATNNEVIPNQLII